MILYMARPSDFLATKSGIKKIHGFTFDFLAYQTQIEEDLCDFFFGVSWLPNKKLLLNLLYEKSKKIVGVVLMFH